MSNTPRAGVPLLSASQAQKHATLNDALFELDAVLCCRLLDRDLSAPPSSPADGDAYLVKATGTGLWDGQDGAIAYWVNGAWRFYPPFVGLSAYVVDESVMLVYTASGWVDWSSTIAFQNLAGLGVNTASDSTNKLAVKSSALLFDNIGGDVQAKINKHAAADTASFLFQTNYSGRAEFGLTGDDDFHLKVSPDGSSWYEALKIARASGLLTLPVGQLAFPSTQNPSSDPNTLDDYEEGTFTMAIEASGSGAIAMNPSYVTGHYTKIGRVVTISGDAVVSSVSSPTGTISITGLPFAADSNSTNSAAIAIMAAGISGTPIVGRVICGSTQINLYKYAGALADIDGDIRAGSEVYFGGHYFAA